MRRFPLVTILEVAVSIAAVAIASYLVAGLFVAWFIHPIGAPR